jgi:hypothetical protein
MLFSFFFCTLFTWTTAYLAHLVLTYEFFLLFSSSNQAFLLYTLCVPELRFALLMKFYLLKKKCFKHMYTAFECYSLWKIVK